MFVSAHSRQKMSPSEHATGSTADSRHSEHEPNGRNESRLRRADEEFHADLANDRSCAVKTGREVFLLPAFVKTGASEERGQGRTHCGT